MRVLVLVCLCFGISLSVGAQQHALAKQWDARFGGTAMETLTGCIEIKGGVYLLLGSSYSGIGGDKTQDNWDTSYTTEDFWVVKTDSLANKIWEKRFGGLSEDGSALGSLLETSDGKYILGGYSSSGIGGDKTQANWGDDDYWIIKIDTLGNKIWDKRFGGTQEELLGSLQQTADAGFILGGSSYSNSSGDKTQNNWGTVNYWVVKIDSVGNKEWDKRYGGSGLDFMTKVIQTNDGGYVLGGVSNSVISGDKTQQSFGGYDYWIVKIDYSGNKLWDSEFGGTDDEQLEGLLQAKDGGYILGGYSSSGLSGNKSQGTHGGEDYWIVKIDSLGNKQWDRDYGGSSDDRLFSLTATNDGGYLLTGNSESPISGNKTENNVGVVQTWLVKTDSIGNKQWDKTIYVNGPTDVATAFQTKDGCYVIGSFTGADVGYYKSQPAWDSSSDYWIVKFCDTLISGITELSDHINMIVSPNPFTNNIAISLQKQGMQQADFSICNILGQTIYTKHETNLNNTYTKMLDLSYLPNGVYFVEVVVDGERVVREVVKE